MSKDLYANDVFRKDGFEFALVGTYEEIESNFDVIFNESDLKIMEAKKGSDFEYFGSHCQFFIYIRFYKVGERIAMQIMDARMKDIKSFFEKCIAQELSIDNAIAVNFICSEIKNYPNIEIAKIVPTTSIQDEINSELN